MSGRRHVLIGGGVIGLSIAYELARRGERVCLLERDAEVGRRASWAGAGILPPADFSSPTDPLDCLRRLSHRLYPAWSERLRQETGIDNGYRRCGGVYLATRRAEAASLVGLAGDFASQGIDFHQLDHRALRQRVPGLGDAIDAGRILSAWYAPDECQIRNPRHVKALAAGCRLHGVEIICNGEVRELRRSAEAITAAITADGREIPGETFCVCGGAWSRSLADRLGLETGLFPVRGQMLRYACDDLGCATILNEGHRYIVPRADATVLVGSNEEEVGFAEGTTEEVVGSLAAWAASLLPQLSGSQIVQTWSGLRPASFDGWPYLGRVPEHQNLFIATGHYRSGLHLACATGTVMADLLSGRQPPLDVSSFRPGR